MRDRQTAHDLAAAWHASPLPALLLDDLGCVQLENAAFRALWPNAAEPKPADWLSALEADSAALLLAQLRLHQDFELQLRWQGAGAEAAWLEWSACWINELQRYSCVLRDATAERLAALEARAETHRFSLLANSVPVLIAYYEREGLTCLYANQQYASTFGYDPASIIGRTFAQVVGEAAAVEIQPHVDVLLRTGRTSAYERKLRAADGSPRWIEVTLVAHTDNAGVLLGAFVLINDISRHRLAEAALRESEDRLSKFMDASVEGIVFHRDGVITDANQALVSLLGTTREQVMGRKVLDFVAPESVSRVRQVLQEPADLRYELALVTARGERIDVESIARTITRRGETLRMAIVRDIRDRLQAQARIAFLAHHDPLTGLPNRAHFMERLAGRVNPGGPGTAHAALLFIDLDHFKRVNDSLGHLVGDQVLQTVAQRIVQTLRPSDLVGRFGGDEFMVLLAEVSDQRVVEELVQRLLLAVEVPIEVHGQSIAVSPSIGVALHPRDGRLPGELVKNADTAMYVAKAAGRGICRFFEPEMASQAYAAIVLEGQLALALQHSEFRLMLQPRVALDGRALQVQALIRWQHPHKGALAPESFLNVAEERRLMQPIVRWALSELLALQSAWLAAGLTAPTVALDLAALPLPLNAIAELLEQLMPPGAHSLALALDLNESTLSDDAQAVRHALGRLSAMGIAVAIDDFGVGTMALARLRSLPVRGLTLGRAFVAALPHDHPAATIAAAIVQMAQGLQLEVTAKGVETEEQRAWLAQIGCSRVQGPALGLPMPASAFADWVRQRG